MNVATSCCVDLVDEIYFVSDKVGAVGGLGCERDTGAQRGGSRHWYHPQI